MLSGIAVSFGGVEPVEAGDVVVDVGGNAYGVGEVENLDGAGNLPPVFIPPPAEAAAANAPPETDEVPILEAEEVDAAIYANGGEGQILLAQVNPWHNAEFPEDIDCDGNLNSSDLRQIFAFANDGNLGQLDPNGPEFPQFMPDVNNDGALSMTDLRMVFAGLQVKNPWHNTEFPEDVNCDGSLNGSDLRQIYVYVHDADLGPLDPKGPEYPQFMPDVNGDRALSMADLRLVFTGVSAGLQPPEGEGAELAAPLNAEVDEEDQWLAAWGSLEKEGFFDESFVE